MKFKFMPLKADICLFDNNLEFYISFFLKKYSTLYVRRECYFLLPLFLSVFEKLFSSSKLSELYYKNCVKIIKPKIIFTLVDNSILLFKMKKYFPNLKFIVIQNAYRNNTFYIDFPSYFNKNDYLISMYGKKLDNQKFNVLYYGSFKLNLFTKKIINKFSYNKKIIFISQFRDSKFFPVLNRNINSEIFYLPEKKYIKKIIDYTQNHNYSFQVLPSYRTNPNDLKYRNEIGKLSYLIKSEESFYKSIDKRIKLFINKKNDSKFVYQKLDHNSIYITFNSNLGLELLSKGFRVLFLDVRDHFYQVSNFASFHQNKFNFVEKDEIKNLSKIIDKLKSMNQKIYLKKINNLLSNDIGLKKLKNILYENNCYDSCS